MDNILNFPTEELNTPVSEALDAITKAMPELEGSESIAALLSLPDDQFALLAPNTLLELEKSLNNINDKLILAQALNAAGLKAEDLTDNFVKISKEIDEQATTISRPKREFIKRIIGALINTIADTEGINKKTIHVPIELCHPDAKIPEYAHLTDSGMDLFALEDITIHPGETVLVPTGIKVALPPGYELQVRPKSGRALKTKLRVANTPGTIKVA